MIATRHLGLLALALALTPACGALGGSSNAGPAAPPYNLSADPAFQKAESDISANRRALGDIPDVSGLSSDFSTLSREVSGFDGAIKGNTERIGRLTTEVEALTARVAALEAELKAHKADWNSFFSSFGQRLRAVANLFEANPQP